MAYCPAYGAAEGAAVFDLEGVRLSSDAIVLLSGPVAFLVSWLVQPHFRSLGFLTGIVDLPGYRRTHREPVPRTGGMAIFISFFATLFILDYLVLDGPLPWSWLAILGGSGLAILALGVGDDRFHIHAEKKLYGQLVVILSLMVFGQRLDTVVLPLLGQVELGGWSWPVTLFWYLGFINSMNLIDGLDGLASGIGAIASLCLVAVALVVGDFFSLLFATTLGGSTLAFMYWNMSRRKIFLGDSGSMWMGLVLGGLMLHLSQRNGISLFLMLAPMVVPIWDTGTTIIRRYRKRASIFEADDFHLHHRLVRLGFAPPTAVVILLLITTGAVLFALSDFVDLPWLGLPALATWLLPIHLWGSRRRDSRSQLDFFSEMLFAMGLDDRAISTARVPETQVAEIIDIQAERRKVEHALAAMAGGGGTAAVVAHPGRVDAARRGKGEEGGSEPEDDVVFSTARDIPD